MARITNVTTYYPSNYYPPNSHERCLHYFAPYYYLFMNHNTGAGLYEVVYRMATTIDGLATAADVVLMSDVSPNNPGTSNVSNRSGLDVYYNNDNNLIGVVCNYIENSPGILTASQFIYGVVDVDTGTITWATLHVIDHGIAGGISATNVSLGAQPDGRWILSLVASGAGDEIKISLSHIATPENSVQWTAFTPGILVAASAGMFCLASGVGKSGNNSIIPYIDHLTGYWNIIQFYGSWPAPVIYTNYYLSPLPEYAFGGGTFSPACRLSNGDVIWAYKNRTTGEFFELQYHYDSSTVTQHLIANLGTGYFSPVLVVDNLTDVKYFMAQDYDGTFNNVLYIATSGHNWTDWSASISGDMLTTGAVQRIATLAIAKNDNQYLGDIKIACLTVGSAVANQGVWVGEQRARVGVDVSSSATPRSGKAPLKVAFNADVEIKIELL